MTLQDIYQLVTDDPFRAVRGVLCGVFLVIGILEINSRRYAWDNFYCIAYVMGIILFTCCACAVFIDVFIKPLELTTHQRHWFVHYSWDIVVIGCLVYVSAAVKDKFTQHLKITGGKDDIKIETRHVHS